MGAKLLRSYKAGKGTRWARPVQNASRIWEELASQPELPQCKQMEFLAGRQEAASCIFSAGVHFSQQVFPQKKALLVLTKDWPKFKNCTKLSTHPASTFNVNVQTGEHSHCYPLTYETAILTIRHATNLHLHCPKSHCTLPALLLFSLHFPIKVFSLLLCCGFGSRKLSTLSIWTNYARTTHSIVDLSFLWKYDTSAGTPLQCHKHPGDGWITFSGGDAKKRSPGMPMAWVQHSEWLWVERAFQKGASNTENNCCQAGWLKFPLQCWCPKSSLQQSPGIGKPFPGTWRSQQWSA